MQIRKAYRYRFNPNALHRGKLAAQFGHTCFVYNWGLALREEHYQQHGEGLSRKATIKLLPALNAERPWLYEPDSQALQQALIDQDMAYQHFFDSCYWETVQATRTEEIQKRWQATGVSALQEQTKSTVVSRSTSRADCDRRTTHSAAQGRIGKDDLPSTTGRKTKA